MKRAILHTGTKEGKSIIAENPAAIFTYKSSPGKSFQKSLQKFLKEQSQKKRIVIGYFAYDLAYELYDIKRTAKDDIQLPDIYLQSFDQWKTLENSALPNQKSPTKATTSKNFTPTISRKAYETAYKKVKHYIKEGDIYQLNLTHRLEAETNISAPELFEKIVHHNPVEFLAYIEGDGFEILSASPERFIKIENRQIETTPIKGTRPRGATSQEDEKFKKELLENEKEAAELNMITDLLRNDLGKICKIGSVKVTGHRLLKKCPTVWHTYSSITGELAPKITPVEALISMLPGGSITGCPKKRAIEIIDELEPTTRSVYTGIIGYILPNQNLDFNIAIRTIIKKGENLYLQVGGGIVVDSKEKAEYDETLQKAKSFMKIL